MFYWGWKPPAKGTCLHLVTRDLFGDRIDRSPRGWKAKTSTIEVAGIALFRGEHCMGQIPAAKGLLLSLLRSSSPEWRNVDSVGGRRGQKEHVKPGSMSNKWTVSV